jgi:hypothetical protein
MNSILIENGGDTAKIDSLWERALAAARKSKDVRAQVDLLRDRYI